MFVYSGHVPCMFRLTKYYKPRAYNRNFTVSKLLRTFSKFVFNVVQCSLKVLTCILRKQEKLEGAYNRCTFFVYRHMGL